MWGIYLKAVSLEKTMVDFNTWIKIGLEQCAPSGQGTGSERNRVFRELVNGWNRDKEEIRRMSESQVRQELVCP